MDYDVVIYDRVGSPYDLSTTKGVGGSEFAAIRLGNALIAAGYKVLLTRNDEFISCRALIVQRYSPIPTNIKATRTVVHLHDCTGGHEHLLARDQNIPLIASSKFHASIFSEYGNVKVIPGMLPDVVYSSQRPPRVHGRYIYASARVKGWDATLEFWKRFALPRDVLHVLNSGYDQVNSDDPSVVLLPSMNDAELVQQLATCSGLFYVNRFVETWGAIVAMADALGTPFYILTTDEPGALVEAPSVGSCITSDENVFRDSFIGRRDYRIKTVLPKWIDILRLKEYQMKIKYWHPIPEITEFLARQIPEGAKVLEIGPGHVPFKRSTHFVDRFGSGPNHTALDVCVDGLPFEDKSFDFVYCRHTIEDLYNPFLLLSEMDRVGKAGYVETPSPMAELNRGVDGIIMPHRGYIHHRSVVWVEAGMLCIAEKSPIVEHLNLPENGPALEADPFLWNTYLLWGAKGLLVKHYQHDVDFYLQSNYVDVLAKAISVGADNAEAFKNLVLWEL